MERFAKILLLFLALPLGSVVSLICVRQARQLGAQGDVVRATEITRRGLERFWPTIASSLLGLLGYLAIARHFVPLEPETVLIIVVILLFAIHFVIRRTLQVPKWKDWL